MQRNAVCISNQYAVTAYTPVKLRVNDAVRVSKPYLLFILFLSLTCHPLVQFVGTSLREGSAEIQRDGNWWGICDTNLGASEANVLCHQLGYPKASKIFSELTRMPQNQRKFYTNVDCIGSEEILNDCSLTKNGTDDCNTTWVTCEHGNF